MAAITLAEVVKVTKDPKKAYVLKNLIRYAKGIDSIPWNSVSSFQAAGLRWRNLPTVAWRALNEGYTANSGTVEQVYESLYGFGGDIQYDSRMKDIKDVIVDPIKLAADQKMEAMGFEFNDVLINGDTATNPKKPFGLKARVALMPARQTVGFAGAGVTALDPTASVANANAFFDAIEKMHVRTNAKDHNVWYANEELCLGIGKAARFINASGGNILDVTKDSLEREFVTLHGSPIVDVGLKSDQTTEIIPNNEVAGDAGTDATSLYCVSFNEKQGIMGAQLNALKAYDPLNGAEQESSPSRLLRIDWWIGFVGFGSYGITRGWNVLDPGSWT